MVTKRNALRLVSVAVLAIALAACSRQQSDWQKTRETNTADGYEQFLKKYPSGEFTAQAQARVKELYEERDWQKARDADTPEAYQAFLKQYPEGKWTEEARIRVENFTLAQAPGSSAGPPAAGADSSAVAPGAEPSESPPPAGPPPSAGGPPPKPTPPPAPPAPPARTPLAVQATTTPAATNVAKAKAGSYGVQLGAFKSGAPAAHERWSRLQKEYPKLLAGLSSKVSPKQTTSGKLYRLQVVGMTAAHARDLCHALKAKSQACVVLPPAHG
jgi:cell division protein FtsN